jgi:hypothetical protein
LKLKRRKQKEGSANQGDERKAESMSQEVLHLNANESLPQLVMEVFDKLQTLWSALTSQRFGRPRPVAAKVRLNSGWGFRRQAADESGGRSPHST